MNAFFIFFGQLILFVNSYSIIVLSNEKVTELLKACPAPIPCDQEMLYGAPLNLSEHGIADVKHKILFEYTPKAGCTSGITTFLLSLGFDLRSLDVLSVHNFYLYQYLEACARPTVCMYLAKDWFRFKLVRNPYERVISSYSDLMTRDEWNFLPKNLSFEQFIHHLNRLSFSDFIFFAFQHGGLQSRSYERNYYRRIVQKGIKQDNPIFHEIVKLENLEEGYQRVFARTGVKYTAEKKHVRKAKSNDFGLSYIGNLSWSQLQDYTPNDKSVYYNEELFKIVTRLFHWDLLLYNYTYPFNQKWVGRDVRSDHRSHNH